MASRDLNELIPSVREKARKFGLECERHGIDYIVTCTYRSSKEQEALYAQGRKFIDVVNALRKKINLSPLSDNENKIVTKAKPGLSLHEYRCAFDVAVLENGKLVWNDNHPLWDKVGEIGVSCGLEWAGNWKTFKEKPHFQYTGGLTISDIKDGIVPA